jgi:predicted ATPase/signal transduction histidine kinase
MGTIPGFTLLQTLDDATELGLYRARREADATQVLLRMPTALRPASRTLDGLVHEWELAERLHPAWALCPQELLHFPEGVALVYPEFPGHPLTASMCPVDVGQAIAILVRVTAAVAEMHTHDLLHRDLAPAHVLFDPSTGDVRLTGFGLATIQSGMAQYVQAPGVFTGTLACMSPEQTGQLHRAIDFRSDLFALGCIGYQLLTGLQPFGGADPLEWVHSIMARQPTPPQELRADVPPIMSALIMKLLAKMPEERYQSAVGVLADFTRCQTQWQATGQVAEFSLGQQDISDRFLLSQRLYGRTAECQRLQEVYGRVAMHGAVECLFVAGGAGVGKTRLVYDALQMAVRERDGFLGAGKFDQYARDIPYATIAQAFHHLVQHVLAESDAHIAVWRARLLEALGTNGHLIVEVIPQVAFIIGPQPPVPDLPAAEAQIRFNLVFRQFLAVFATQAHPLVLFLDDLQWADAASLALLEHILTHPDTRFLYLVGAYRDTDVDAGHPLMGSLTLLRAAAVPIQTLPITSLSLADLTQLIADSIQHSPQEVAPLAELVFTKTGGNPFFVVQFLATLHRDGLIAFNRRAASWEWDLAQITNIGYTDNVAAFMVEKLQRLPEAVQGILQRAACISAPVELPVLATITPCAPETAELLLAGAMTEGLIRRVGEGYQFLHDRIQQVAYTMLPEAQRRAGHLEIGRRLQTLPPVLRDARLFDLVTQLNLGASLITDLDEQTFVATLNLQAGRKARTSAAYASAYTFFTAGLAVLPVDGRLSQYDLAFALSYGQAECAYLTGHFEETQRILDTMRQQARTRIDQAAIYRLLVDVHTTRDAVTEAFTCGLEGLRLLGIDIAPHPSQAEVLAEYRTVRANLGDRTVEELLDLPPMTDPEMLAVLDLLSALLPPALFTDNNLFGMISCVAVNVCLQHGNAEASPMAYALFGSTLCGLFEEYEEGYRFGKLGYAMVEKYGYASYKAKVCLVFGDLVNFWTHPFTSDLAFMREGLAAGHASGDLSYACYCANHIVTLLIVQGERLEEVWRESERHLDFVRKARYEAVVDEIMSMQRLVQNLRGLTLDLSTFSEGQFEQTQFEAHLDQNRRTLTVCWYYILKVQARYLFGDYGEALAAGRRARDLIWSTISHVQVPEFYYYYGLTLAALAGEATSEAAREADLAEVRAILGRYQSWALHSPQNYRCRAALLAAEVATVEGRLEEAFALYREAIHLARADGLVHQEALANERAGRLAHRRRDEALAISFLQAAHYCYRRWGAEGKVRQLEHQFPQVFPELLGGLQTLHGSQLDFLAVVKASQAISSEIMLSRLIETLLRASVEHAGAQRGILLLARDATLTIVAEAGVEQERIQSAQVELPAQAGRLPQTLLTYVQRTCEHVLLPDASAPHPFSNDAFFRERQPKSILCVPIVRQTALIGLLYLENNLLTGAFTPERVAVLELLAAQAAISLENARLYAELQQENSDRRQAEQMIRQLNAELDERVKERTTQLEVANRELEAFSYSVSHDLRAPLRSIDGFSQALLEDYEETLDADGQDYLRRVRSAAQRMAQLIDDLLRLSRIGRAEMHREPVDMSALATAVVVDLHAREPAREVVVEIAPEMVTHGDTQLLRIVLENLLANAWKFTGKRTRAEITVGQTTKEGTTVFFVRDNGAGLDQTYAHKLFTPFQRLHAADEFPGTGIGLAIVSRIIHRHGGQLWIEGAPQQGATIYFRV